VGGRAEINILALVTLGFLSLLLLIQNDEGVAVMTIQQGGFLLFIFIALLVMNFLRGRAQGSSGEIDEFLSDENALKSYLKLAFGMVGLWLGADFLVSGASDLAILLGISETVVGLTVVAAGTGAPELFASIAALRKGSTGIALGNILGSNIFNTLGIIGAATVVAPLPLSIEELSTDLLVMAIMTFSLGLTGWLIKGRLAIRTYGLLLMGLYVWWLLRLVF